MPESIQSFSAPASGPSSAPAWDCLGQVPEPGADFDTPRAVAGAAPLDTDSMPMSLEMASPDVPDDFQEDHTI